MLPIRDDQPRYSTPYVNGFLIGLNLLIFLFEALLDSSSLKALIDQFAVVPAYLMAFVAGSPKVPLLAGVVSFFTSMFFHRSWVDVIRHVWVLFIFWGNLG